MEMSVNVNLSSVEPPYRILVSGSRSLDERRLDDGASPQARRACREARAKFIRRLEERVVGLAVCSGALHPVVIVHGAANLGADNWADRWLYWAWESGTFKRETLHVQRYPARWRRPNGSFDKGAGMRRNGEMIDSMNAEQPHVVLVCWDGASSGTKNLLDRATVAGLHIERTWQ